VKGEEGESSSFALGRNEEKSAPIEGPGFKSQPRRCLRQTVHTHRASVYQAAKSVAALLWVAGVTAGQAESTGSLPPGL